MTSFDRDFDDLTFDAELFDFLVHNTSMTIATAQALAKALTVYIPLPVAVGMDNAEATAIALPISAGQLVSATMAKALASANGLPLDVLLHAFTRSRCVMPLRGEISYGGFILNHAPYAVDLLGVYSPPKRTVQRVPLLRAGSSRLSTHYDEKLIAIQGRIVSAGRGKFTMEQAVDDLQRALNTPFQTFKAGWEDERYYQNVELVDELQIEWDEYTRNIVSYTVKMLAADPFALAATSDSTLDTSALSTTGGTIRQKSMRVDVGGNIYNWPLIRIALPAIPPSPFGMTVLSITNVSVQPNQSIEITYPFSAGDIIQIDSDAQTVTINDVLIDFEGQFIYLDPRLGANTLTVQVDSSAVPTFDVSVFWTNRFLS